MNNMRKKTRRGKNLALCSVALVLALVMPCRAEMPEEYSPPEATREDSVPASAQAPATDGQDPAESEVRELWTGSLYTSSYRVGVCFTAQGELRGVVHLRLRNGQVDVYHIRGSVKGKEIRARHGSGHSFAGRFANSGRVEGTIRLKNGMKVRLEGRRTHNAALAPENCAPL